MSVPRLSDDHLALIEQTAAALAGTAPRAESAEALVRVAQGDELPPLAAALFNLVGALLDGDADDETRESLREVSERLWSGSVAHGNAAPVAQAFTALAAALDDPSEAAHWQRRALDYRPRDPEQGAEAAQERSILLFNLAHYHAMAGEMDEAVRVMRQVIALDEQYDLPDLESDREALAAFEARQDPFDLSLLEGLGQQDPLDLLYQEGTEPSEYASTLHAMADEVERLVAAMQAEQDDLIAEAQRRGAMQQGELLVEAALDARRDGTVAALLPRLDDAETAWRVAHPDDSPLGELAAFARALAAYLRDDAPLPVPPQHAAQMARLTEQSDLSD